MSKLSDFVAEIQSRVEAISPADFFVRGRQWPLNIVIQMKLQLDDLSKRFLAILGRKPVSEFFQGHEPGHAESSQYLFEPLSIMIPECCQVSNDRYVRLDKNKLIKMLTEFEGCVHAGEISYSLALRITNIDIENGFDLAEGIHFRKLTPNVVQSKYPIMREYVPVLPAMEGHWHKHSVEIVIPRCGKPLDIQESVGVEHADAMVNSILHAFLLVGVPEKNPASVTHIVLNSLIGRLCHHRSIGSVSFEPKMLTLEEIEAVQKSYAFLKDTENDLVLQRAVDRFILGMKRGRQHPNRVNQPNWDKIVDYVIAMETLFLTASGDPIKQEQAYRFRLNGSLLLHECTGDDVRQTFHALNDLYNLRSRVVHGGTSNEITKAANKFIERVQIDCSDHQHPLGRLMLVARKIEEWMPKVLFRLGAIPVAERLYKKPDGWEEILWKLG